MFCVCVCVCVFWIYMLCILFKMSFESLICWFDAWVSSLIYAFISMCFFLLEKLLFFKLDSSLSHPRQISFLSSLLLVISTDPLQLLNLSKKISKFCVCPIDSRQILDPSRFLGFLSIATRQLLNLSRPCCMHCFSHVLLLSIILSSITSYFFTFMHLYGFLVSPWSSLIVCMFLRWSFIASCTLCQSWQKGGENVVSF